MVLKIYLYIYIFTGNFLQILELSLFVSSHFVFPVHLSEYTDQIQRRTQNHVKHPKPVTYFAKCCALDVWQDSENASEINTCAIVKSSNNILNRFQQHNDVFVLGIINFVPCRNCLFIWKRYLPNQSILLPEKVSKI